MNTGSRISQIRSTNGLYRAALIAVMAAVATVSVGLVAPTGASAEFGRSSGAPAEAGAKQVTGKLVLNCTGLDPEKRKYAVDNGYCPTRSADEGNGVGTQGVVYGDCGYSFMWLSNRGSGVAQFSYGTHSDAGAIAEVSWMVIWTNERTGQVGSWGDNSWPVSSDWGQTHPIYTGSGNVWAQLSGSAILIWGATCTILNPSDYRFIS